MKGGQVHEPGQFTKENSKKYFVGKHLNIHLQTKIDDQWKTLASNTEKAGGMKHLSNNHDLQLI